MLHAISDIINRMNKAVLLLALCVLGFSYDTKIAHILAKMAAIAYEPANDINAWRCDKCKSYPMTKVKVFSRGDCQGFAGHYASGNAIIVSFRGSSNIPNWVHNMQLQFTDYHNCKGCQVHNGFIWNDMMAHLQALNAAYPGSKFWVTGHSLGGAQAHFAVADIHDKFGRVDYCVTMGQPRVGNNDFAHWMSKLAPVFRVTHHADLVPHLPPGNTDYKHCCEEVWYDQKMEHFKKCEGDSEHCSNSVNKLDLNLGDHSVEHYYEHIKD